MGTAASESSERDRVFSERLLTIEWQQRALPEVAYADAGSWLLIDTSDAADLLATMLTDALKSHGPQGTECTNLHWSQEADHAANLERLGTHLRGRPVGGVVILCGPRVGDPDERSLLQGREQVRHLVRIARELAELEGETSSSVRRDQASRGTSARRRDQPGAGRAAWPAAGDRQ